MKNFLDAERSIVRKGRILIMDDDEIFCNFMSRMLGRLEYDVGIARDGAEAIELYKKAKESGQSYDVVIIDLIIPGGMGGKEAMEKLLEIDPDIKAIVSSGYSNDPLMVNYREYGFRDAVEKPYTMEELITTLSRVLTGTE